MSKAYTTPLKYDPALQGLYEMAIYGIPRILDGKIKTVNEIVFELNASMITQHADERITPPIIMALDALDNAGLIKVIDDTDRYETDITTAVKSNNIQNIIRAVHSQKETHYTSRSYEKGYEEKLAAFLSKFYKNVKYENEKDAALAASFETFA